MKFGGLTGLVALLRADLLQVLFKLAIGALLPLELLDPVTQPLLTLDSVLAQFPVSWKVLVAPEAFVALGRRLPVGGLSWLGRLLLLCGLCRSHNSSLGHGDPTSLANRGLGALGYGGKRVPVHLRRVHQTPLELR